MKVRRFILTALCAALLVSLTGCSKPKSSTDSASTGPGTLGDDVLKVGITQKLTGTFCPMYAASMYDQWVVNMVYQSMLAYDADGSLVPVLASEAPEVSKDGKTIRFHLKEGLRFSDGSELDGDDIKYSFTLMADPEYVGGIKDGTYDFIEGFEACQDGSARDISGIQVSHDGLTVTFTCAQPDSDAVASIGTVFIVPEGQFPYSRGNLDAYKNLEPEQAIGTGPYVIDQYDPSWGAVLKKNPDWNGDGQYPIESVAMLTIEAGTEVQSLQDGTIDLIPATANPDIIAQASALDNVETSHYLRAAQGYIGFNCQEGVCADPAVRQALAYATDQEKFVEKYYAWPSISMDADLENVNVGYVPKTFWSPIAHGLGAVTTGDKEIDGLIDYSYDPDKASAILDAAGWKMGDDGIREKDGRRLEVRFLASQNNSVLKTLLPMLEVSWRKIGAELRTNTISFNALLTTVSPSSEEPIDDWDAFFMVSTYSGQNNSAMNLYEGYTDTANHRIAGGTNYAHIFDEALNADLSAGKSAVNQKESVENYQKAMIRASELCPYEAIYGNYVFNLYSRRLQSMKTGPLKTWSQALADATLASSDSVSSSADLSQNESDSTSDSDDSSQIASAASSDASSS